VVPHQLLNDILNEQCVVFLGAGASTEGRGTSYWRELLIDGLTRECGYPKDRPKRMQEVTQYYCKVMNAGYKGRLVRLIRERIQRFMKYAEAYNTVTVCHHIIASIPHLKVVVTTNWDPFMERAMNVIPIVRDTDIAYWDDTSRQVIKMHGCITDPSSMVITLKDYKEYVRRIPQALIPNKIRDLMSTKTFLFIGYSLVDPSFQIIHSDILKRIGNFARTSFAVLPDIKRKDADRWKKRGVIMIKELAYPFLETLRNTLVEKGVLFPFYESIFRIEEQLHETYEMHSNTDQDTNVGFLSAMYQDGLQHGLSGLIYSLEIGLTRDQVEEDLMKMKKTLQRWRRSRDPLRYSEIAYYSGRVHSLQWFVSKVSSRLPKFFSAIRLKPIEKSEFEKERQARNS